MSLASRNLNGPRSKEKDFNFQLHHRLSKFEVPVVVNSKAYFSTVYIGFIQGGAVLGLYHLLFDLENIRVN